MHSSKHLSPARAMLPRTPSHHISRSSSRHAAAVARTLVFADAAADQGEYGEALAWLGVLDRLGDDVPADYERKRRRWRAAVDHGRAA